MSTPTPYRRSPELSALLERHRGALPPVASGGRPPLAPAPGNPSAPRADASQRPAARPTGTRTATTPNMTRAEAGAIVRRMMRQAAAPPRLRIRVLVPLAAAPSLLARFHKVTQPPAADAASRSLLERFERVTAPRPRPAA